MNQFKQVIMLLGSIYLLTGCEEVFKGQLDLSTDLVLEASLSRSEERILQRCEKRNFRSSECRRLKRKIERNTKTILAGEHQAKLIPSKRKLTLKILNAKGKTEGELKINVPKGTKLPRNNGRISLLAADTGFNYDIDGEIQTDVQDSEVQFRTESCSWREERVVCRRVQERIPGCVEKEKGKNKKRRNCMRRVRRCHTEYVTRHGDQNVEFFLRHTHKDLQVSMVKPNDSSLIGEFGGQYNHREKIYTYRGQCR